MVAIFNDGRQKGISQTALKGHQLILDTGEIRLTKKNIVGSVQQIGIEIWSDSCTTHWS